ncbi:MAG TPA: formimidoylglutamate deiminase [Paracoccaceae bacterium]|nr:formimidoylglutamate deiminase [Paracoccaceae bacterium]HMO71723.1 formimidoylglutamate deiminase [Paracoccaceae bacterium]
MDGTIWAETALLPGGWAGGVSVTLAEGRIASVETGVAPRGMRVPCLLPAPVNLHSHTFQRAMAGLAERRGPGADSFWTWRAVMYRFLDRLTPEDVEAIAGQAMVEMAEAGFAAVCEFHYLHHGPGGVPYADRAEMAARIVAAAETAGLGLTLLPVVYMQGGCEGRPLEGGQKRFRCDPDMLSAILEASPGLSRDGVLGIAPHSLRAVPPAALAEAMAMRPGAPLHIHAAEQPAEVDDVRAALGARPVEWLLDRGVDARWCLIHTTHMTAAEVAGLAASGAVAGLCPITEANLGDGIFEGAAYRAAGGRIGVGTDSNILISLAEELRTMDYAQRLRDRARSVLAPPGGSVGRDLFDRVAAGGAQAAGRAAGAIAPGLWADLMALDTTHPSLAGASGDGLLDGWIFACNQTVVTDLWSAGRHVVHGGRHVARAAVAARYRGVMARLRDAL